MITVKKHFVIFLSPGTFFSEQSELPIKSWDTDEAMKMARKITERYNATPYGFYFSTRERGPTDLDSRETKTSPMYYLGGKIETIDEVRRRADPKEEILLSNMECNHWDKIIVNTNSWKFTAPWNDADTILDFKVKP